MHDALIGYTGFVGSNLLAQHPFDFLYNSRNIEGIRGVEELGLVVCAAPGGVKWRANKYPEQDWATIESLMAAIRGLRPRRFVLLSSIDVYPEVNGVDEGSPIDMERAQPYSRHRRLLELFVQENFPATVIRLSGLFGRGLKKNVIFDLLHGSTQYVHQDGVLQYYNLQHLWPDIETAVANDLALLNLAPAPTAVKEVALVAFGIDFDNNLPPPPPRYDMHSKHASLWGKRGYYQYSREEVLAELKEFVEAYRGGCGQ